MKLLLAGLIALAAAAGVAQAGPLNETDRYGETFAAYAQVDRPDGSFRRMLTTPDVLATAQSGAPLPDGTRILMETYRRSGKLGTVFHKQKVDGRWHYGSFDGQGRVDLATRPQASCLSCHSRAAATDLTFTKPALTAARTMGLTQITCDRAGRRPCDLEVYLNGVGP